MANKEEISFVLNSNLDKVAQHAKMLSENVDDLYQSFRKKNSALIEQNRLESVAIDSIRKLSENYSQLTNNIGNVVNNNKNFIQTLNESQSITGKLENILKNLKEGFSNLRDEIDKTDNKLEETGKNSKEPISKSAFDLSMKAIRVIGDTIHDIVKSIVDSIRSIGVQLAKESLELKPFAMEFMSSFSFNPLSFFGFGAAMKESFQLMLKFQQMRHELAFLSDASGDASKALSLVYEVSAGSAIASGTAQGVLRALADQGIIANGELKSIGILSGNLQAATGIAASSWANFTGELAFNYGITTDGLENITSALIGTNIRGAQLEKVMGTVNKVLQNTGFIAGVPTTQSIHDLTKSIGGASKTFQSLGISAEKSGAFIEGIMNPENFEKNAFLFAKLGISASEYAGYLNDADGQQKLLQKTMANLPQLASEISNIQNPFARTQFAKTIGLDMQMVQKMAGKTQTEIEQILADYEKENKGKEALEAKKQKMASEAAKFDDMMLGLKLKVLAPVMEFLSGGFLNDFFAVLPNIAKLIASIFQTMTPIVSEITNAMLVAFPVIQKVVQDFLIPFFKNDFPKYVESFLSYLPGFDLKGKSSLSSMLNLQYKDTAALGKDATKQEIEANKKQRGENLGTMIANVASYLSKIYLFLIGWKLLTGAVDMFQKVAGVINPNFKNVMNATVGELANAIGQAVQLYSGGGAGGKAGIAMTVAQVAAAAVAAFVTYKVASSAVEEAGGTKGISERIGIKSGANVFEKVAGEKGLKLIQDSYQKILEYGSKGLEKMGGFVSQITTPVTNLMSKITTPIGNLMSKLPGVKSIGEIFTKIGSTGGGLMTKVSESFGSTSLRLFGEEGLKGAAKGGLKAASSWKTLGAGFVGGIAGETAADVMGGNEKQKKAAKNTASVLSSSAAAFALAGGGPQGAVAAGINMAIEGGLRGFEESDRINKLVKDKIGPSFLDPIGDPNLLDDVANKLQGGLGGALTLGLGFIFDDVATMITGETSDVGATITGQIGEKFVKPLRMISSSYEMMAGEYAVAQNNYNQKFKLAGDEFNNYIKTGNYAQALGSLGDMIGIKFKQYIVAPLKGFFQGLFNMVIVLLAEFQDYMTGTELGKTVWSTLGLPNFQKMVVDKKEEQNTFKTLGNLQSQLQSGNIDKATFEANISGNPALKAMLEKNSSFKELYDETMQLENKKNKMQEDQLKLSKEQLDETKKGNKDAAERGKIEPPSQAATFAEKINFGAAVAYSP